MLSANQIFGADAAGYVQDALPIKQEQEQEERARRLVEVQEGIQRLESMRLFMQDQFKLQYPGSVRYGSVDLKKVGPEDGAKYQAVLDEIRPLYRELSLLEPIVKRERYDYDIKVQPKKLDKINDLYVKQLLENVEQYRSQSIHQVELKPGSISYGEHLKNLDKLITPMLRKDMDNLGFKLDKVKKMQVEDYIKYSLCLCGTFGDFVDYAQQAYEKSLEVIHRVDHVLKDGIEKLSIPQDRKKNMLEALDSDTELKRKELYNSFDRTRSAMDRMFLYFDNMVPAERSYMCNKFQLKTMHMGHSFASLLKTLGVDQKKYQAAADKTQFMLNMIPSLLELDDQKGDEKLQLIEDFLKKKETFEVILFSQLPYLSQETRDELLQQHNELGFMLNEPFVVQRVEF